MQTHSHSPAGGTEAGSFLCIPRVLFTEEGGRGLSLEAKTLYGLMLDRTRLSARNGWTDRDGQVYIYFTQAEIQRLLHCGHNRATALVRQLESAGLLLRKRQGLGRPMRLYVQPCTPPEGKQHAAPEGAARTDEPADPAKAPQASPKKTAAAPKKAVRTARKRRCRPPEPGRPDRPRQAASQTEKSQNEKSQTESSSPSPPPGGKGGLGMERMEAVQKRLRDNIGYEELLRDHPLDQDLFDGYLALMTEACCTSRATLRICGEDLPAEAVRSRFFQLEREHILYVRDCLCSVTTPIGSIKAYTLAALYNAPATMGQYYAALVSRDLAASGA